MHRVHQDHASSTTRLVTKYAAAAAVFVLSQGGAPIPAGVVDESYCNPQHVSHQHSSADGTHSRHSRRGLCPVSSVVLAACDGSYPQMCMG
jgi:hypothetical protein